MAKATRWISSMNITDTLNKATQNRAIESKIIKSSVIAASTWTTLIAPIIIGAAITRAIPTNNITIIEGICYVTFTLIHRLCTIIICRSSSMHSLSREAEEIIEENNRLTKTLLPEAVQYSKTQQLQTITCYLATLELEQAIEELNKSKNLTIKAFIETAEGHFARILKPLTDSREQLFGYREGSLYNIALYIYSPETKLLHIRWRDCDKRLGQTNRSWQPGFGHVGLSFLHNEIKICPDISKSTELTNSYTETDTKQYRSFLSVPISECQRTTDNETDGSSQKPFGVIVLTSATPEQFSLQRDKILMLTIAKLLSIYIDKLNSSGDLIVKEENHEEQK